MGVQSTVEINLNFGAVLDSIFAGTVQGMNQAGEFVLAEAVDRVPMDNNTLRLSGAVEHAKTIDDPVLVTFDTPYAARLHEHPEYNFSKDANPNAQGKYLEDAAMQNTKEILNEVRDAIEQAGDL